MRTFLVVGTGCFGLNLIKKLNSLGHEVMAVDKSENSINAVMPYVTNAQIGDSTDESFMRSLGVRDFDVCIVTINNNFEASLQTVSFLKESGAKKVVARAANEIHEKFLLKNGADEVVYPERQMAEQTALRYCSERILDYVMIDDSNSIFEVTIPPTWIGKTVGQIDIRKRYGVNIMGLKKNGKLNTAVSADTKLDEDSTLMVLGEIKDIQKCFHI